MQNATIEEERKKKEEEEKEAERTRPTGGFELYALQTKEYLDSGFTLVEAIVVLHILMVAGNE